MTRNPVWLLIVCLLAVSCGKGSAGSGDKEEKSAGTESNSSAQAKRSQPNIVHISEDAQRIAQMRVVTVESRPVANTLNVAGQIMPNEERTAHIGSYTSGRVMEIKANVGDRVQRGQVLARLHSHEVHETLAAYRTALEDVRHQQTAVDYSTRMRDRMQRLYGLSFASTQEVERAEADLRTQKTNLADAQFTLERETAHLSDILHMEPAELPKVDESKDEVPVISPISGVVTVRAITAGSVVEPGQEVYTVTDLRSVWMMASVYEPDIAKIRMGAKATVKTQAYPEQEFHGVVMRMGTELDPKTRTLPVRLLVPNPGEKLRTEMFANAELSLGILRPALFVPEEAMQDINGGAVVFVWRSAEEFEVRPISVENRVRGEAQVGSGVKAGEQVVVKGSFLAKSELLKSQIGE